MFNAVRRWLGTTPTSAPITYRRDADAWIGFLQVGKQWFEFRCATLTTADGSRLVTSFYLVVDGDAALAFRRAKSKAGTRTWYWQKGPTEVAALMLDREALPYRVFAIEGSPQDRDASLAEAVVALQHALRFKSAQRLRKARMSPDSPLHVMPAEIAADMHEYPGYDGVGTLRDYLAGQHDDEEDGGDDGQPSRAVLSHEPNPNVVAARTRLSACQRHELLSVDRGVRRVAWLDRFEVDGSVMVVAHGVDDGFGPVTVTVHLPGRGWIIILGSDAETLLDEGSNVLISELCSPIGTD